MEWFLNIEQKVWFVIKAHKKFFYWESVAPIHNESACQRQLFVLHVRMPTLPLPLSSFFFFFFVALSFNQPWSSHNTGDLRFTISPWTPRKAIRQLFLTYIPTAWRTFGLHADYPWWVRDYKWRSTTVSKQVSAFQCTTYVTAYLQASTHTSKLWQQNYVFYCWPNCTNFKFPATRENPIEDSTYYKAPAKLFVGM